MTPIKFRDKDVAELKRVVKNYNEKIRRVSERNPEIAQFQPEKVSFKNLKQQTTNRKDFNKINVSVEMLNEVGKIELSFKDLLKHYFLSVSIVKVNILKEKAKSYKFSQELENFNNDDWILFENSKCYTNISTSDSLENVFKVLNIVNSNINLTVI